MISRLRIPANRPNAHKITGPRTALGKSRGRANALRGEEPILPGQSQSACRHDGGAKCANYTAHGYVSPPNPPSPAPSRMDMHAPGAELASSVVANEVTSVANGGTSVADRVRNVAERGINGFDFSENAEKPRVNWVRSAQMDGAKSRR